MFKIHRNNFGHSLGHRPCITTQIKKNMLETRVGITKTLMDNDCLNRKLSNKRLNSYKHLTRENVEQLSLLRDRQQLNNKIFQQDTKNYNLSPRGQPLPRIPDYKPQNGQIKNQYVAHPQLDPNNFNNKKQQVEQNKIQPKSEFEKSIDQLPTRTIETTEDMAKVFNSIMNGTAIQPQNQQNKQEQTKIQLSEEQLNKKILQISNKLKVEVLDDNNIDYIKIVHMLYDLKLKFRKNNMIKSIMQKSLDRYNRTQFIKIPDDKLKNIIDITVSAFSN